jgi:hypothetical protein
MDPFNSPSSLTPTRDPFNFPAFQNVYANQAFPNNAHLNYKNTGQEDHYDSNSEGDSEEEDEFIMGSDGKMIRNTNAKRLKLYPNGRKRASKACYECQRRHTRCGFQRPCERCKRLGLECVDVQSIKKRGRSQKKSDFNLHYQHTFVNNSPDKQPFDAQQSLAGSAVLQPINTNQQRSPLFNDRVTSPPDLVTSGDGTEESLLLQEIDKMEMAQFSINVDLTKNQTVYPDKMGVIVSQDVPGIQYVSDSIVQKLGHSSPDAIKSYYDLFIPLHVNWSMQSIKDDRQKRITIMQTIENGTEMLRQNHLKTEHQGRALVIDKQGSVIELVTKAFRVYNRNNPSKLEGVYTFLFWN